MIFFDTLEDETLKKFIGTGVTYPFVLNERGSVEVVTGINLVRSSLAIITSWQFGNRFYLGEFGSVLAEILEDPNDVVAMQTLEHYFKEAISKWEKRVEIIKAQLVRQDDTTVYIGITYRLTNTKLVDSFIFPYYKNLIF